MGQKCITRSYTDETSDVFPRCRSHREQCRQTRAYVKTQCSQRTKTLGSCDTKDDFASMCLKATQDFIATKELITNSKTLKSLKFFTLRRKDNLLGNNEIAETMNDFYTSASLSDHSKESPVLTPLLEMAI